MRLYNFVEYQKLPNFTLFKRVNFMVCELHLNRKRLKELVGEVECVGKRSILFSCKRL